MTGMPAATAVLDGFREGGGVGDGDDQAVGLGGDDGVDHLRQLGHVEGFGREIFGLDAERLGGVVHAVLDDRPVGVAALAVGDEDDAGLIGGSKVCRRRHQGQPGQQAERRLQYLHKREHQFLLFVFRRRSYGRQSSCSFVSFLPISALVPWQAARPPAFIP